MATRSRSPQWSRVRLPMPLSRIGPSPACVRRFRKAGLGCGILNWALRYTESVTEPFVTSEAPLVAEMLPGVSASDAVQHPDTLLYFPICWQVCLFGSRRRFDLGTDKLGSHDMTVARRKYRLFAQDFLISPVKLDDITDFCGTQVPANTVAASATGATCQ